MAITLKNALLDGQLSFERGVDTERSPSRVPRNQCCLLVNNTTRRDFIGPRAGWKQIPLSFIKFNPTSGRYEADPDLQEDFEDGFFQGFSSFVPDSGPTHLVFSISGKIIRVNPLTDGTVQEITGADTNPVARPLAWFCQGEIFLVIQDGQSIPFIYDGVSIRRSNILGTQGVDPDGRPLTEVPIGTCMAYSGGRFWVALTDGRSFAAGDGVYGPTGTAAYQSRDSILRFTENNYLRQGLPFAVPSNMGPIRAMVPLANLDTSLGQGPLQVFTPSGCFSVQAPFDRAQWALVEFPIQTVSLLDQGALAQRGCVLVNGDAWYRSMDGVRSFMIARRDFNTWGNRAMSAEVTEHLENDDRNLLDRQSCALFDNRLLSTCTPQWDPLHGVYHKGLVVLDFNPLTSIAGPVPPVWSGLWNGPEILQIASIESQGVTYCFAAVLAPENDAGDRKIQLWQLTLDSRHDTDAAGVETRISRVIVSPRLDFQNRLEQKTLEGAELWFSKIRGTVDFTLYFRPNEHACWFFWKHWQVCATTQRCPEDAVDGCMPSLNLQRQYRSRIGALRPPDETVEGTGEPSRVGYAFQIRLEVVGDCDVTAIRLVANRIVEAMFGAPGDETCEEVICCPEPES